MWNGIIIITFLAGLIIGSFLNVLILRINDLRTVLKGRSHCPHCAATLAWYDLIPLASFVLLKARCRYCNQPISWQYPAVELGTAILMLCLYIFRGFTLDWFFYALVFSVLIVVLVYDLKTQTVPEEFTWLALILSLLGGWYFGGFSFGGMILGGLIGAGLPALLVFISRETWMGSGDIKIGGILGLLLGYPMVLFGLFSAFIFGSIIGLLMIALRRKTAKDTLPFAPFLITAILTTLFFGDFLLAWYRGAFLIGGL